MLWKCTSSLPVNDTLIVSYNKGILYKYNSVSAYFEGKTVTKKKDKNLYCIKSAMVYRILTRCLCHT